MKLKDANEMLEQLQIAFECVPTYEAEPIKHGRWILSEVRSSKTLCCSICGLDSGTLYEYNY